MRIALVAYGCEPNKGSEQGVGWTWAKEICARGHDVVVYTHGSQREAIERAPPLPGVHFCYHQLGQGPLEHRNRAVHQLQYTLWQWSVMNRIVRDAEREPIDLVHFLTWGGVRMPVFGWRSSIPYIIGPVGGGEEAPLVYCLRLGVRVFAKEVVRKVLNRLCLIDPLLAIAYRHATQIYAKTSESRNLVVPSARHSCFVRSEIGAKEELLSIPLPDTTDCSNRALRLVFVGRLLYWKCPLTVVAVYRELLRRGLMAELTIVGAGPEKERLLAAIRNLPPEGRVNYQDRLPQSELFALMQEQDLAMFPSLHDSSGNFVLESLSCGLPVLALALGGPRELLKSGGGLLVSVDGQDLQQVITAFVDHIQRLIRTRSELDALRQAARASARAHTWRDVVARVYAPLELQLEMKLPPCHATSKSPEMQTDFL
ncbi:glycosyltransferase family 4 protein [Bradyrhizobium sp. LB12.1]|uniref:glycosyltransferase family 4 protein n=1 Tax=Bradyrhizobium sp. LB12.1 TaxID=3156327 RepID=UPI0033994227